MPINQRDMRLQTSMAMNDIFPTTHRYNVKLSGISPLTLDSAWIRVDQTNYMTELDISSKNTPNRSLEIAQMAPDKFTNGFAPVAMYNSDVLTSTINAHSECSMQCHGNCASESADSKGYSADFFESCSSIGEVGHFLCCGGVCADATVFSSPSPRFTGRWPKVEAKSAA